MKTALFILFFLPSVFRHSGQTSNMQSTDQFDSDGKKNGTWKQYYDRYWHVIKDSSEAAYYWYTYYDHGLRIYTEADWGCKTCKFQDSSFTEQSRKIKLLDGKYTWYDKKGNLFSERYFKNGHPVWWKEYYSNGKLYLLFDYTKKCEGEPLSWCLYQYDKQGILKATLPASKGCGGTWIGVK
jgi:antitoxin component YwqK of YwqJK toxin-antitoxin module